MKLCAELMLVLRQLHAEGFEVYTYKPLYGDEYQGLFWFENGRVLNIQPSTWRNEKWARDLFNIGVSYIPSQKNGSGCQLHEGDMGLPASELLKYRKEPTWVHGVQNFKSLDQFLKHPYHNDMIKLNAKGEALKELKA